MNENAIKKTIPSEKEAEELLEEAEKIKSRIMDGTL